MPDKPTTRSTSSIVSISRATSDLLAIVRGTHAIHMRTRIACPGFAVAARPGRDGGRTRSGRGRSRSGTVYRARTSGARTARDSRIYFFNYSNVIVIPLHVPRCKIAKRCTHPTPDVNDGTPATSVAAPTVQLSSRHRRSLTGYRAHWVNFLPSVLPSNLRAAGYTRHDHAPWSHHPPTLIYAPHGSGKHHGSHHSAPICGPLPCSHLLQRSHQECDGVIGLLFSERVDCRIQLRGEAVLGEVLKHPRGAPCWSRGCGSR